MFSASPDLIYFLLVNFSQTSIVNISLSNHSIIQLFHLCNTNLLNVCTCLGKGKPPRKSFFLVSEFRRTLGKVPDTVTAILTINQPTIISVHKLHTPLARIYVRLYDDYKSLF